MKQTIVTIPEAARKRGILKQRIYDAQRAGTLPIHGLRVAVAGVCLEELDEYLRTARRGPRPKSVGR